MMPLYFLVAADTLMVRQVPPIRTGFEETVFVAAGLAQIVTLVVIVLLALIFRRMWKAQQLVHEQLVRLTSKVDPMLASATSAAENVRVLTDVVRKDAVLAAEALTEATGRVRDSVSGIADRIDDFGDLMGRVIGKADAAADVAGAALDTIKAGARFLRPQEGRKRRPDDVVPRRARGAVDENARDERSPRTVHADRHERAERAERAEPDAPPDDERDDSPYAAAAPEASPSTPAPRRRRRRGRGRRPPA